MTPVIRIAVSAATAALLFAGHAMAQDYTLRPRHGGLSLTTGFQPDPVILEVSAGGEIDLSESETVEDCVGHVSPEPTFSLNYRSGVRFPLIFIAAAESEDVMLLVNDPIAGWHCRAPGEVGAAQAHFLAPLSGRYDVWVGRVGDSEERVEARLVISEIVRTLQRSDDAAEEE